MTILYVITIFQLVFLADGSPDTFDFVIVGGGTAGCTLARRLSDAGNHSVLVLEAGGIPHPDSEIPALACNICGLDPSHIRNYQTVPQQNAGLSRNGTLSVTVGRVMGGSSSVNAMVFNRGSPHDFNNWAKITKDQTWSYSNLLPFFKRSETYEGDFPSDQHGYDGPITVSRPRYAPSLNEWFEAGKHLGYRIADPNGPQTISYAPKESSLKFGRRVSAYAGYIRPIMSRQNLRVLTHAEVTQIVFEGNKAVGVRYRVNNNARSGRVGILMASARKEVILSAGAIESPALLLKSGIGPKHILNAARIRQIKELPVGRNLHDHPMIPLTFILNNRSAAFDSDRDLNPETLKLYNKFGDGPYSLYTGLVGQAYLKSPKSPGLDRDWADFQLLFAASTQYTQASNLADWEIPVACYVVLSRPASRGTVTLDLADPTNNFPNVDFQYFSERRDMDLTIDGIKAALSTFENTPSFRKLGARYPPQPLPACLQLKFRSDEYWECYVKQVTMYGYHAGGTCRMGSGPEDLKAVVDSKLRVIGMEGIRVVDASIMPNIATTNLQAPVYAIAEKASNMILTRWKK